MTRNIDLFFRRSQVHGPAELQVFEFTYRFPNLAEMQVALSCFAAPRALQGLGNAASSACFHHTAFVAFGSGRRCVAFDAAMADTSGVGKQRSHFGCPEQVVVYVRGSVGWQLVQCLLENVGEARLDLVFDGRRGRRQLVATGVRVGLRKDNRNMCFRGLKIKARS